METDELTPASTPELEPDAAEIMGTEDVDDPTLGVKVGVTRIDDPVRVRSMPARGAATREYTVLPDPAPSVRILTADPRRARAIITSDGLFFIGTSQPGAESPGMRIRIGGFGLPQYEIGTTEEIWASAGSGGGPITVWVYSEQWAD